MKLTNELVKDIFDHVRNYIISSTVIAAGILIGRHGVNAEAKYYELTIAILTIILGIALFALNATNGLRRVSDSRLSKMKKFGAFFFYAIISIGFVGQLWMMDIK